MLTLNTTMLREKFIIREKGERGRAKQPIVAVGNRLSLPMVSANGQLEERLIIRAQNMHTALRIGAMVTREFFKSGPLLTRSPAFPWEMNVRNLTSDYEHRANPKLWAAIYHRGKVIYRFGEYHPFLDVIEQCDARNRDEYDKAVNIAEQAFLLAGSTVSIDHQTTIAAVIGMSDNKLRCGLIYRSPKRSSTFNVQIEQKPLPSPKVEPQVGLFIASAWLEAIQMAVTLGFSRARSSRTRIKDGTETGMDLRARRRIGRLNTDIKQYEQNFEVKYRPDKPDVFMLLDDSEKTAKSTGRGINRYFAQENETSI